MTSKSRNINLRKVLLPPLAVTVVLTIFIGLLVFSFTLGAYRNIQEKDRVHLTQVFADHLADNIIAKERIEADVIEKATQVGEQILADAAIIDNTYLAAIATRFDIEYILYYNPLGEVVYDASGTYIGRTIATTDPEYAFLTSDLIIDTNEAVRTFDDGDQLYKFVYLRQPNGFILQVGVEAFAYFSQTRAQTFQLMLNDFVEEEPHVHYALVVDQTFEAIADTDTEDIGVIYTDDEDYTRTFAGEVTTYEWSNHSRQYTALEISSPIYFDETIEYILAIGFSLDYYYQARTMLLISFIVLAFSIVAVYVGTAYYRILRPLTLLGHTLDDYDDEKANLPKISSERFGVFSSIYEAIYSLTSRITTENYRSQKLKQQVSQLAYLDYLTKIPNRRSFVEHINPLLPKQTTFATLFLDLDGFKTFNDINGHIFGDRLLISVANRLKEKVVHPAYISRYGGDEFLIFFPYQTTEDLNRFATELQQSFEQPFEVEKQRYPVGVSVGVSLYPQDGTNLDDLIRKADIAMYEAKKAGKNHLVYFEKAMSEQLDIENNVLKALKKALVNDGITLVFQPQVEIATNRIVSLESLARLANTHISASSFFEVAEKAGLIKELGRVVIRKTILQLASWKKNGMAPITTYVNISSYQLEDADLTTYIKDLLKQYQIEPHLLGFEVTERTTLKRESLAEKFFVEMHELGVKTSLDDFGTGQAGLTYLTKYSVGMVKLDRLFATSLLNEKDLPVFEAIVRLAQLLHFDTLAHGIETRDQLDLLKKTSCHLVQGFVLYRPMTAQQIFDLFVQGKVS